MRTARFRRPGTDTGGAASIAAAPRVAHSRHEPGLEHRHAAPVAIDRVHGARLGAGHARAHAEQAGEHRLQRGQVRRAHHGIGGTLPDGDAQARRAAAGAGARRSAAVALDAAHALDGRLRPARALVRPAGQRPDAGDRLRCRAREVDGHPPAGREAEHDQLRLAHAALVLDVTRDGQDLRGLAALRRLFGRLEPVPAAVRVRALRLRGIDDHEAAGVRRRVQTRAEREVLRRLPAAVQGDDERPRRVEAGRNPHPVRAPLVRATRERAGGRGGAAQRRQQAEGEENGARQDRRARRGSKTRPCLTSQTPRGERRTNGRKSAARKKSVNMGSWCG